MLVHLRHRTRAAAIAAAVVVVGVPGVAHAAPTITAPSCVHAGEALTVGLSGFTPNTDVQVKSLENGYYGETLTTDAAGSAEKTVAVGYGSLVSYPYVYPGVWTLQATDANGTTAVLPTHVAMWMFDYSGGRSLKAKRTWRFSGWVPGKPLYGHYRHEGKTYDNVRFGVPTGPCGYLKTKKPLLSVKTKRPGTWTVWVDQSKTYKNENPLSLSNTFSVVRTYFF